MSQKHRLRRALQLVPHSELEPHHPTQQPEKGCEKKNQTDMLSGEHDQNARTLFYTIPPMTNRRIAGKTILVIAC